jgi:RNA polymerase sigma-70 factor (ECF subfamily)
VELYSPLVNYWCRLCGLQEADAADVRQEVFMAVARKIAEFQRRDVGAFRGWLRAITRSKVFDHGRRLRCEPRGQGGSDELADLTQAPAAESGDCEEATTRTEEGLLYRQALDLIRQDFEERTWQAFWHVVVDDRSPGEVATALGMSPNSVYLAKSRVLARLREEFAGLIDS